MRRLLHVIPALAVSVPLAAAAAPDIPANRSTTAQIKVGNVQTKGVWDRQGDSDWYRVDLRTGTDLAVYLDEGGDAESFVVTVRDSNGHYIDSAGGNLFASAGLDFHVPRPGVYYVDVKGYFSSFDLGRKLNGDYYVAVIPDCLGSATTRCRLEVGKSQRRRVDYDGDIDDYTVNLVKGKIYEASASAPYSLLYVNLYGKNGGYLSGIPRDGYNKLLFQAPYTGPFIIEIAHEPETGLESYILTLKQLSLQERKP